MGRFVRQRGGLGGQSLMESVLLLPLYLLVVFALLQIGEVAAALVLVNYGVSSTARRVVYDDLRGSTGNTGGSSLPGSYKSKLEGLLLPGMRIQELVGCYKSDLPSGVTVNLTVAATAEVSMFPLIQQLAQSLNKWQNQAPDLCSEGPYSPVGINGNATHFIVRGRATARLNYRPQG